jgi:hypothetical protein
MPAEAGVTNAMSAKGQKQTLDCRPLMSALPPKLSMIVMSALCH